MALLNKSLDELIAEKKTSTKGGRGGGKGKGNRTPAKGGRGGGKAQAAQPVGRQVWLGGCRNTGGGWGVVVWVDLSHTGFWLLRRRQTVGTFDPSLTPFHQTGGVVYTAGLCCHSFLLSVHDPAGGGRD